MVTSIVATRVEQGMPGQRVISSGRATCVAGADEGERGEEGAREAGCELRTERVPEKAAAVRQNLSHTLSRPNSHFPSQSQLHRDISQSLLHIEQTRT
jgi:hypothetical protein